MHGMARAKHHSDELIPEGVVIEGGIHGLLGYQLARATIITTEVFNTVVGEPLGLRPVEFTILQLVEENPLVTATKLAKALAITKPGVTVWLDRLEKRGLLARKVHEEDRRTQNLCVTPDGRKLVSTALAQLLAAERQALQALSEGERRMLLELLHKFARTRPR